MKQTKTTYNINDFGLSNNDFCPKALGITQTLQDAGYEAYLVGGCIRDLLSGLTPKDFDIVTNATPEQVEPLFERTRVVGRRFKLALVYPTTQGRARFHEYIEVATFRASHKQESAMNEQKTNTQGMLVRDNVYGTLNDDAARRDFTLNALYYDPSKEQIIDFYQGVEAIRDYKLDIIGNVNERFVEDPVRILRGIRFQAKLDAQPDAQMLQAMQQSKHLLAEINHSRLYEEVNKLLLKGNGAQTLELLRKHQVLPLLFANLSALYNNPLVSCFIQTALENSDRRIQEGKYVVANFLYAVLLWPEFVDAFASEKSKDNRFYDASQKAFQQQNKVTQITKRLSMSIRDIWRAQFYMSNRQDKSVKRTYEHPKFRAAYDFTLLREKSGFLEWENNKLEQPISAEGAAQWWTEYQEKNPIDRKARQRSSRPQGRNSRSGGSQSQQASHSNDRSTKKSRGL